MGVLKKFRLRDGERVVYIIRHWIGLLVPNFVVCFLIIVLDFFLMYYLFMRGFMGVVAFFGILIIVGAYLGRLIFLWRRNVLIITNQRLIDWEQTGFFNQMLQEITFDEIEKIEGKNNGFWGKLLKFGNLIIKIDNEKIPLELYNIKDPIAVLGILKKNTDVDVGVCKEAVKEVVEPAEEKGEENVPRLRPAGSVRDDGAIEEDDAREQEEDSEITWKDVLEDLKELELEHKKTLYREFKDHLKDELKKTLDD